MRNQQTADISAALTPQPLYGQVRQALIDRIRNGEWMVGDSLPNETFLAQRFGVSVGTVRKAIEGLENNGLVKRIQGRGTYVAGVGSHVLKEKFARIRDAAGDARNASYELLSVRRMEAPAIVTANVPSWSDEDVLEVKQQLLLSAEIVGVETSYLRAQPLPNFQKQLTFGQDIYALLADYGFIVTNAAENMTFVEAGAELACLLSVAETDRVMCASRRAYGLERNLWSTACLIIDWIGSATVPTWTE